MQAPKRSEGQHNVMLLVTAALFSTLLGHVTAGNCPWDGENLKPWNESSTWPDGSVPRNGSKVIIRSGTKVLLNVPVTVASLTIQSGAELIWANLPDLELRAGYILVDGAFHLGSRTCRFRRSAFIRLTGRTDSKLFVKLNDEELRKAIIVREGGTLELHGKKKTSWTRLAQTIPALKDLPCAFVYDHSDHKTNPFAKDRSNGLHVMVWNEDGSVFDYSVYKEYVGLKEFVSTVPKQKVIGMYAYGSEGLGNRKKNPYNFKLLDDVIMNDLGGRQISDVTEGDSYSLLTKKGYPSSTQEYTKKDGRSAEDDENFLQLPDWDRELVFQVATSAETQAQFFRVLQTDAAFPVLELADDIIGWQPGDKIVIASTDFDWKQAEVRHLMECKFCSRSQIRVDEAFRYLHFGNFTYNVDERAEVGLLTRNILIEGVMEDECYYNNRQEKKLCERFGMDTFGADVKILANFASVHVQGVELYHVGKQKQLGAYPLHFHMADEVPGAWLRDNSIHHSFSRCVTIHGTDKLEVSGNVCYDHLGHGYFLEDSVEQNNILSGNLGLGTRFGTLLLSDSTKEWCKEDLDKDFSINCAEVSTFWLTHPNNDVSGNVAAGGECHGFMYVFADAPLGPSYKVQERLGKVTKYHARTYPIKRFFKNTAHSNIRSGVFMDSFISSGGNVARDLKVPENGVVQEENEYDPRDPPGDVNGTRVWTTMERITAYKNGQNNMWIKGGNVRITSSSMADPGSQSYSGGCTGFDTGTSLEYSIVIGRTDNVGEPTLWAEELENGTKVQVQLKESVARSPWKTLMGVGIYQGPMYLKHTYFDRFADTHFADSLTSALGERPVRHAAAVSFKKDSTYPTYTSQYTTNLTFGYCDNKENQHYLFMGNPTIPYWKGTDGPRNAYNYDKDGSLTGTPNTAIVRNYKFTTGPECLYRDDWNMSLCPYRYIKVDFKGYDGSLKPELRSLWSMVARRDDVPEYPFYQEGKQRREYLARTHKSYLVGFNTTLKGAAFPSIIKVYGYGVEKQDMVRVGLCVPKDLKGFEVDSDYPVPIVNNNYTRAYSLKELDADTGKNAIFYDKENGIIFFKIYSLHDRTNDSQQCAAGICYKLRITLQGGTRRNVRDCFEVKVPPYEPSKPIKYHRVTKKSCPGIGSPEGLGAVRWDEVHKIVHKDFSLTCPSKSIKSILSAFETHEHMGCYDATDENFELPQTARTTMTVEWCIQRCYQREYRYAGLTKGSMCMCGRIINGFAYNALDCARVCSGSPFDRHKTCGDARYMDIWKTTPVLQL